jgi:hypothetical protein
MSGGCGTRNGDDGHRLPDRKLGHEWADWDGDLDAHQADATAAPQLFFFCLCSAALSWGLLIAAPCTLALELLQPPPFIAALARLSILALSSLPLAAGCGLYLCWRSQRLRPMALLLMACLIRLLPLLTPFAKLTGKSRDQLLNSFLQIRNSFISSSRTISQARSGPPLLLAPRCMTKESMQALKLSAQENGAEFFIAATGAKARDKVAELKPCAIVAVACERDLISGIRDVAGNNLPIIALPITLPAGPCKGALADLDQLADAIAWIKGKTARERAADADGGKDRRTESASERETNSDSTGD